MLISDEIRYNRAAPKPEEIASCADDLEGRHGDEAFRALGKAMAAAQECGDGKRHRLLKAVASELIRRDASRTTR